MSVSPDDPNMVISDMQFWLWAQKLHPPADQTLLLRGAANQRKEEEGSLNRLFETLIYADLMWYRLTVVMWTFGRSSS